MTGRCCAESPLHAAHRLKSASQPLVLCHNCWRWMNDRFRRTDFEPRMSANKAESDTSSRLPECLLLLFIYPRQNCMPTAPFKKEAAPPEMGGTASGVETTDLSGGGQAAISRGTGQSSLALPMGVTCSASSSSCSAGMISAGSAKRITSGTQAIARSRTSTSVM